MSLEEALAANTAAIEKHTAALEKFLATAKSGPAPTAGKPAATNTGKSGKSGKSGKPAKAKEVWDSEETYLAFVTEYFAAPSEKAEKKAAAAAAKPILDHFGATRFSEIDQENWEEACGYLQQLKSHIEESGYDDLDEVDLGLSNEDAGEDDESPI